MRLQLPFDQQIGDMWNATYTQTGANVSIRDGNWTSINIEPTACMFNGTPCSVVP